MFPLKRSRLTSRLTFSSTQKIPLPKLLLSACGIFCLSIAAGLVLIMVLNGGVVNHVLTPVLQFISLFTVLWDENPSGALQFLFTKSVFSFVHKDPRSGLNLWTYEFDSITLLVYVTISMFCSWLLLSYSANPNKRGSAILPGLTGSVLILISISYMTVIEHCSGATWVGFVSLYGMGFDEFELYPVWQWLCGGLGTLLVIWSIYLVKHQSIHEI